jgi:two-component system CheB/CheR fusion protein
MAMKVMVVDDDADAATSLAMLLRILGNEVVVAHDGPAALDAVALHRPDVALVDINLPSMTGDELARRIRELPLGKAIRLVALSGWGRDDDRRRQRASDFDAHLVKPADPDEVVRLLRPAPAA